MGAPVVDEDPERPVICKNYPQDIRTLEISQAKVLNCMKTKGQHSRQQPPANQVLKLEHIWLSFAILGAGVMAGAVVFVLEQRSCL